MLQTASITHDGKITLKNAPAPESQSDALHIQTGRKARITKTHIYFANTGTIPVLHYESNHPYQKEDQARFFATMILAFFF